MISYVLLSFKTVKYQSERMQLCRTHNTYIYLTNETLQTNEIGDQSSTINKQCNKCTWQSFKVFSKRCVSPFF